MFREMSRGGVFGVSLPHVLRTASPRITVEAEEHGSDYTGTYRPELIKKVP